MDASSKPIRLSRHALEQLARRGATEAEVHDAIRTVPWQPAELNRQACRKAFRYEQEWHGKRYSTKEVRPIFAEEATEIVVVTVYVYYS